MTRKVLIIGNSAKEHALADRLKIEENEVHVASGNSGIKEFATCLDIRQDSTSELVEYAMENDISLTIPTHSLSLNKGITNIFKKNNLPIFAPGKSISDLLYDKASLKKLLYRLGIPTPKFGIFEKPAMAFEYLKNIQIPFVLKTNSPSSATILTSVKTAKSIINSCFEEQMSKIIIEDYVQGVPFCFYVITDGYKALPIGSSRIYRFALDGDGGQLTNGMGACSPFNKLTIENEQYLMDNVVNQLLDYFQTIGTPYLGIMGIEAVLTPDNKISVLGINTFMQDGDCQSVLNNIDTDLCTLFESCIIGSFSDDVNEIPLKDISSTSVTLNCVNKNNSDNPISGLDLLSDDTKINFCQNVSKNKYTEFVADYGQNLIMTCSARTSAYATSKVYDEIENIKFAGKAYRKDIGRSLHYNCAN